MLPSPGGTVPAIYPAGAQATKPTAALVGAESGNEPVGVITFRPAVLTPECLEVEHSTSPLNGEVSAVH